MSMRLLLIVICWLTSTLAVAAPDSLSAETTPETFVADNKGDLYYPFTIDEDTLRGAPDFSDLNHPIGLEDRIIVKGAHFYRIGPTDKSFKKGRQRIRLFGTNLSYAANFPAEQDARNYARRLKKLGFNAVRLHHLDSHPSDETTPPRSILSTGPYPTFNEEAVRRLRTFIAALAAEGLYINLNLRVGYRFRPDIDNLPALDTDDGRPASVGTPIHVYYPPLIEKQELYLKGLIEQLGLKDNPALAMVEINNESSLLAAWIGDAWWGDTWRNAIPPTYAPELQTLWTHWVLDKYGSEQEACQTWDACNHADFMALPVTTLSGYSSANPDLAERIGNRLRRWLQELEDSSERPENIDPKRRYQYDFLSFLTKTDQDYLERLRARVRELTGFQVPVTGTQMSYGGVLNFDSHAGMDYLDNHIYVGHHVYANGNPWQSEDWRVPNTTTSQNGINQILALSLRRDANKPFVISEYNQPFPAPSGSEILPLMATAASLQDWDGLFFFNYDDSLHKKLAPWYFSLSGDWGKYALSGQSAWLFRTFRIPALKQELRLPLSLNERLYIASQGHIRNQTLEKHAKNRYSLSPQIAWQVRLMQAVLSGSPLEQTIDTDTPESRSVHDTIGQTLAIPDTPPHTHNNTLNATPDKSIIHSESAGFITLNTPFAAGYFGRLTNTASSTLGPFPLRLNTPAKQDVQIFLTPLDNVPLVESRHLLLTLGSDTVGSQPGTLPKRPKTRTAHPAGRNWLTLEPDPGSQGPSATLAAQPPSWMRRQDVSIGLPADKKLTIYPLDDQGMRKAPLPIPTMSSPMPEQVWMALQARVETASPWYEIVMDHDLHQPATTHSEVDSQ